MEKGFNYHYIPGKKEEFSNMKKRGQVFALDLMIAIAAFLIILLSSIWLWEYMNEKINSIEKNNDLGMIAKKTISALTDYPGRPANWTEYDASDFNSANIQVLGLAKNPSINGFSGSTGPIGLYDSGYLIIDERKLSKLESMNTEKYPEYKKMLGVLGPNYEFSLRVDKWNGINYSTINTIGLAPDGNAGIIIRQDRFTLVNDSWADVIIEIWQKCTGAKC